MNYATSHITLSKLVVIVIKNVIIVIILMTYQFPIMRLFIF